MADHALGGISSRNNSTPASSYKPPHLRSGCHLPTADVPSSMQHVAKLLQPTFSMTCFDAGGDDHSLPSNSCATIRLQILSRRQEGWSPERDYLRGDSSQALCFYLSRAPAITNALGVTSGTNSSLDLTESIALSTRPSATSSIRERQSRRDVPSLRFAGYWKRTSYEQILFESLMDIAEKSTASSRPSIQDAGSLPLIKDRIKVSTKVDKCFFRAPTGFLQGLQTRNLSVTEVGDLISGRQLSHQSVARPTTARNIINGRHHLLISGSYKSILKPSCKISILCGDREHPTDEYKITLVFETDATAAFPEQQQVQGAGIQSQKLHPTWRETSNAKIISIYYMKRAPRIRNCFVSFLRQRKLFDFRLAVENRPQVLQTEPECEAEIRKWVTQAWNRRSKEGILKFSRSPRFKIKVVRYREFMEVFKSDNFKVKMSNVTQTTRWDNLNMTSEWDCLLQSIKVKKMCSKGIKPDDVDMLVPLVHELVEETTKLSLAMGDVTLHIKYI